MWQRVCSAVLPCVRLGVIAAGLLGGCAGGWTGEITGLGACRHDVGEGQVAEVSAVLERTGREGASPLEWTLPSFAEGQTTLHLRVEEHSPVRRFGGEGCAEPITTSAVTAWVQSEDGALDEVLEGTATAVAPDQIVFRLERPADALEGAGAPPEPGAMLRVEASFSADGLHGSVTFDSEAEEEAGAPLAVF